MGSTSGSSSTGPVRLQPIVWPCHLSGGLRLRAAASAALQQHLSGHSTAPSARQFNITLERPSVGARLGVDVDPSDGRTILVTSIGTGLVSAWNDAHPDQRLECGDRIIAANGKQGDVQELLDTIRAENVLHLTICRGGEDSDDFDSRDSYDDDDDAEDRSEAGDHIEEESDSSFEGSSSSSEVSPRNPDLQRFLVNRLRVSQQRNRVSVEIAVGEGQDASDEAARTGTDDAPCSAPAVSEIMPRAMPQAAAAAAAAAVAAALAPAATGDQASPVAARSTTSAA
mmetsp:Transcript_1139/g.2689  ORF Transcript_1139/g.2689 Transcript_1139/m.2689 type:complete len:284 (+) Transcript_1139:3-854(+)